MNTLTGTTLSILNETTYSEGKYPEIIFNWEEDDDASMQKICPRLMEVCEF